MNPNHLPPHEGWTNVFTWCLNYYLRNQQDHDTAISSAAEESIKIYYDALKAGTTKFEDIVVPIADVIKEIAEREEEHVRSRLITTHPGWLLVVPDFFNNAMTFVNLNEIAMGYLERAYDKRKEVWK